MTCRTETAVDFVRGDMVKTFACEIGAPKSSAGLEEVECADDIRVNEVARAGDGTINVRLRRQMQDMSDGVFLDDFNDRFLVAKIDFLEHVF